MSEPVAHILGRPEARDLCVHEWLERRAAEMGDAIAVRCGANQLSFEALNRSANHWACALRRRGVGPETMVGICGSRTPDLVVALFAILKAGGAYVPLDPSFPDERIASMVETARISLVLATPGAGDRQWPGLDVLRVDGGAGAHGADAMSNVASGVAPDNIATVIFTSGSAGVPKGVALSHRAIASRLSDRQEYAAEDVPCQKASLSVVGHIGDLLTPLLRGFAARIIEDDVVRNVLEFARCMDRHSVRRLMLVPSQVRALLDNDQAVALFSGVRDLITSGEALTPTLLDSLGSRLPGLKVYNSYGLSESCGAVTIGRLDAVNTIHVGRVLAPMSVHVVDDSLAPVPVGVEGELCVSGCRLARGYIHRPALTAEHFVPNPFGEAGERMYRTGDLGRFTDGRLEVFGRSDHEVKIRGLRVNMADVELALEQHPAVTGAAVVFARGAAGDGRMRGYAVTSQSCSASELRHYLAERLASHMVPASVEILDRLPLLPNGKVDRQQLRREAAAVDAGRPDAAGPGPNADETRDLDAALAAIWAEVLEVPRVTPADNFFELGGDSLLAMRLLARIEGYCHVELLMGELFDNPTITALMALINQKLATAGAAVETMHS